MHGASYTLCAPPCGNKRFRKHFSLCSMALQPDTRAFTAIFTLSATSQPAFRSCANRPILALLLKISPGYKRGNAFGLDSRAWTYRERGGKRYHCASNGSTMPSDQAKSTHGEWASEGRNERLASEPIPPIELSRGLVDRPGARCLAATCARPRCNFVVKRETADENPGSDCCTSLTSCSYQGQGPWILRRVR